MSSGELPKAILYSYHNSVWSAVALLCLLEKGYSEDEYVVKEVDLTKGENFAPSYLKINANGTLPTLVVPSAETTNPEVPTRYRSLRDTIAITTFLDAARTSNTTHTTSSLPAPALAPATIEGKTMSDSLIALVHLPTVDPNFFHLAARSPQELQNKANDVAGQFLTSRQNALTQYISDVQAEINSQPGSNPTGGDSAQVPLNWERKTLAFLQEKKEANKVLYDIYTGNAGAEKEQAFYEASQRAWVESLPDVLNKLAVGMKGPFALGDHVSIADLHIIAWLARLVSITGAPTDAESISRLEEYMEGKKVGPKIKTFWAKWLERDSFKTVYKSGLH